MMYTIAIIFLLFWILGLVVPNILGGYIHILFGMAVILILVRIVRGPGFKTTGGEINQGSLAGKPTEKDIYPEKRRTQ